MSFPAAIITALCTLVRRGRGYKARKGGEVCESIHLERNAISPSRQPLERVVRDEGRADPEREEGDPRLPHPRQDDGDEEGPEEEGDQPPWRDRLHEDDEKPERKEEDDDSIQAGCRQVREGRHLAADGSVGHNPMAGAPTHAERGRPCPFGDPSFPAIRAEPSRPHGLRPPPPPPLPPAARSH